MKIKLFYLLLSLSSFVAQGQTPLELLLLPSGTAKNPGRLLDRGSEREVTLRLAQHLRSHLAATKPELPCSLINPAGHETAPFQLVSLVNGRTPAFLLSLNAYPFSGIKPRVHLFYRCYNPLTDGIRARSLPSGPIRLDQAYLCNFRPSLSNAQELFQLLKTQTLFELFDPLGIPLSQLIGITCPSITLEVGINKDHDLIALFDFISQAVGRLPFTSPHLSP